MANQERFVQVPNAFARNLYLKPTEKLLLIVIASHAHDWFFRRRQLADETGIGLTTLAATLNRLELLGFLTRTYIYYPSSIRGGERYEISWFGDLGGVADRKKEVIAPNYEGHIDLDIF